MKGMELLGFDSNKTIQKQKKRGRRKQNPFDRKSWKAENRISLDLTCLFNTPGEFPVNIKDIEGLSRGIKKAHEMLKKDQGDILDNGIPMTGWRDLPEEITQGHLKEINNSAAELSNRIDAFASVGIGGSYLGLEATFKALTHKYFNRLERKNRGNAPEVYFLGQNTDPDYLRDTLDMLRDKVVGINIISKSGTTLETAITFRVLRNLLEKNWGEKSNSLIYATTSPHKGILSKSAGSKGYKTFAIPENIGGRFSVLTDAGLFGLAMANIDIQEFVEGFRYMRTLSLTEDFWKNPSLLHAAVRHAAWLKGKKIEVVATNSSHLYGVARWMEQLFPESEGHCGRGMWVSPSIYPEKLHANGQMVQQGARNIFETFLMLDENDNRVPLPYDKDNIEGLNFMAERGIDLNKVNRIVIEGPAYAHHSGNVPNIKIILPRRNAFCLGQLYYMLEKSVALSGYLFGHNPFIQPGVEDYKKAVFALLEKPGLEEQTGKIKKGIKKMKTRRV